jgi:UMF1 family MFS transporter
MGASLESASTITEKDYRRRIWAWTMYDWANSAFVTTVLAAVLPIYFSQVAGSTLPSPAIATAYWSTGLSFSLLLVAILSPILGTVSDVMRGKKPFLAVFVGLGVASTALLIFVESGDWVLASVLAILGRIGFNGANSFYDALLPHVAREEDRDRVSTRGYAMGYLGGGLLLAVNIVMIQLLPGTWGARLSFFSVAIWWAVFSIPLFRRIPEPPAATARLAPGETILSVSIQRLSKTLRDMRQYRQLFLFLVGFLIYNDGIGTIIGVAAIYGSELGFGSVELILALLLVQFVGIPFSLIFGRLPDRKEPRRPLFLAFILYNLVALPLVGIAGARLLPSSATGTPPPPFASTATSAGQGKYAASDANLSFSGVWSDRQISAAELGTQAGELHKETSESQAQAVFKFNGQQVRLIYDMGPQSGTWAVLMDGAALTDPDTLQPLTIDAYHPNPRYSNQITFDAGTPGEHVLTLVNTGEMAAESQGTQMSLAQLEVLPPIRHSNLGVIIALIAAVEVVGLVLAWLVKPLFSRMADSIDTKRGILIALVMYGAISIWGYFLDSVIEFWFLAWMVAVVQGGSQALSRSLFAAMSPSAKSGEFFGLFGIMEKFSAILGPLIFAYAATTFGSSRPAVLSIVLFFIVGGYLLTRVNVAEGRRVAKEEDAAILGNVGT